jgi:ER-bound oxygenase mpaB/B'/Rubber oxygenase, catalytic domain
MSCSLACSSSVEQRQIVSWLQLWVAACLYRGVADVHALLHGRVDDAAADAVYRECRQLGTTLRVPEGIWPGRPGCVRALLGLGSVRDPD